MLYLKTPEVILSGKDSHRDITRVVRKMGVGHPLIILDPNVKKLEFGRCIIKLLSDLPFFVFSEFSTNPTIDQVASFFNENHDTTWDGVIAIGGGSAIDVAKAINIVLSNGGQIKEYLDRKPIDKPLLPFLAVPTTCGTGSESSPYAVISDPSIPKKRGIESPFLLPDVVILDVTALISLEGIMVAATAIDCLAHVLESHISRKATALTRITSSGLLFSLGESMEKGVLAFEEDALERLLYIAFAARLLYPRTGLSVAHALSHPVGAFTDLHHGMSVAFLLTNSLRYNLKYCYEKIQEAELLLGLRDKNKSLIPWLEELMSRSGVSTFVKDYLSDRKLPVEQIAKDGLLSSNIPSNPRPISERDAVSIVYDALTDFGV
jgi:alcohol dehydrogenase class IV